MNKILHGDAWDLIKTLPDESVNCVVSSPPYYSLRNYGIEGQFGLEKTPEEYVNKLADLFDEIKCVLTRDGTAWLNLGDSFSHSGGTGSAKHVTGTVPHRVNLKPKNLIGIPWRVAFELQKRGWYLRQDIIWAKPSTMPESVKDRFTKSHEYVFLLAKSEKYYFNHEAILEPATGYDGRKDTYFKGGVKFKGFQDNTMLTRGHERWVMKDGKPMRTMRDVWRISPKPFKGAHFAVMPERLAHICISAGCPDNGTVLDPFCGAGTVAIAARKQNKNYIGFELNEEYIKIANNRIYNELGMFS